MKIITLSLHSYQEDNAHDKLYRIAKYIADNDIDVACFNEASQLINTPVYQNYVRVDNAIKVIKDHIKEYKNLEYEFAWDFSHYGFKIYEEGVGILSKHPITQVQTKYVTKTHDIFTFKSRKILKAKIDYNGELLNVYAVHLGWYDDDYEPFSNQLSILADWVSQDDTFSILAGNFSNDYNTQAYKEIISKGYHDQYLLVNDENENHYTFSYLVNFDTGEKVCLRTDYIFTTSLLYQAVVARRDFIEDPVSDHVAVYIELEKKD